MTVEKFRRYADAVIAVSNVKRMVFDELCAIYCYTSTFDNKYRVIAYHGRTGGYIEVYFSNRHTKEGYIFIPELEVIVPYTVIDFNKALVMIDF